MNETITRFAVKKDSKYYTKNRPILTDNIWEATLYKEKPATLEENEVVMVDITYKEVPYEVKWKKY